MVTVSPFAGLKDLRLILTLEVLKGAFGSISGSAISPASGGTGSFFAKIVSLGFWSAAQLKKLKHKKIVKHFISNKEIFFIMNASIMPEWLHAFRL